MSDSVSSSSPSSVGYEAQQHEYQVRTEAMLNSLGEGLIVTDEHGAITTINSYALKALGFEEGELVGKWMPKSIIAVDQSGRPMQPLQRPIIKALTTGHTVSAYSYYQTKSGAVMPVHINVSPIIIDDVPTGAIEVFRDLTKEQQLDVAKDEFVSLASHQLRTPATAVKSILAMLASGDFGPLTAVQQKYIEKAILSNNRQLQVIEDLLNVALVDAGRMELDLEYADLTHLLNDAVADHIESLRQKEQSIQLDCDNQVKVLADIQKMRMAIDNLIGNASKYSPPGTNIQVALDREKEYARLRVIDQGVGIPEEDLPNIFTKFTRLPNEMSSKVGGTGLGLFLTKSIIELHHGKLSVESRAGKGSQFTVCLPLKWSAPS